MLITSPSSSTKLPPFIIMQDQILSPSDPILTSCLRPSGQDHRRLKPLADHTLKCPRCESLNTKFCYYNNYSLTQPRYFCKNCKRYWTKGGALRNVPVGGGCRKNKRSKQRSMDRHQPSQSPSPAEEELRGGLLSGCCNIHGDGPSSSSSSLQQDFSSSRASTEGRDGGFGLSFERLDQSTRGFSVSNAPISINWAPPPFHLQPFDSNILSLNLTSHHLKQEPTNSLQNADDLTPMYDPHLNLIAPTPAPAPAPAPSSLNENRLPYNLCLENFGNTDLRWRLPPRLVTLAEEGSNERMLMQSMEDIIAHESFRPAKGKFAFECMGVSGEVDEHGNESSPDWNPPASEGFFEVPADAGYWNNGSWPSDLTMYGQLL